MRERDLLLDLERACREAEPTGYGSYQGIDDALQALDAFRLIQHVRKRRKKAFYEALLDAFPQEPVG